MSTGGAQPSHGPQDATATRRSTTRTEAHARRLANNTDDDKWYRYHTVGSAADATWSEPPPEPEPGPRFGEYLLVWDRETGDMPERLRVLGEGESPQAFPDRATWTGSVTRSQLEGRMKQLRSSYPAPRFLSLTTHGDDCESAMRKFLAIFGGTRTG